jgi:hypothetical protein
MVSQKANQQELMNQIKTLCYDMLLDIIDVADKSAMTSNSGYRSGSNNQESVEESEEY